MHGDGVQHRERASKHHRLYSAVAGRGFNLAGWIILLGRTWAPVACQTPLLATRRRPHYIGGSLQRTPRSAFFGSDMRSLVFFWAGHTSSTYLFHPWGNNWIIGFGRTYTGRHLSTLPRAQHPLSALATFYSDRRLLGFGPRDLGIFLARSVQHLGRWTNASASLPTIPFTHIHTPLSQPYYFYIGELASLDWLFNMASGWIYGGTSTECVIVLQACLLSSQLALFLIYVSGGWGSEIIKTKQRVTDEGLWL